MAATTSCEGGLILYDDTLIDQPDARLFDPDEWRRRGRLQTTDGGRGASWMIARPGADWVLRHYRRGGAMRFVDDRYLWPGALRYTRPWREWHYLAAMRARALPVPRPVAAHARRTALVWRGDLITERIDQGRPLSAWLREGRLAQVPWQALGQTLARFHAAGAAHPDLNAHNILLQPDNTVWLIDFDRGGWSRPGGRWTRRNLQRLRRSLIKLTSEAAVFEAWQLLVAEYERSRQR